MLQLCGLLMMLVRLLKLIVVMIWWWLVMLCEQVVILYLLLVQLQLMCRLFFSVDLVWYLVVLYRNMLYLFLQVQLVSMVSLLVLILVLYFSVQFQIYFGVCGSGLLLMLMVLFGLVGLVMVQFVLVCRNWKFVLLQGVMKRLGFLILVLLYDMFSVVCQLWVMMVCVLSLKFWFFVLVVLMRWFWLIEFELVVSCMFLMWYLNSELLMWVVLFSRLVLKLIFVDSIFLELVMEIGDVLVGMVEVLKNRMWFWMDGV